MTAGSPSASLARCSPASRVSPPLAVIGLGAIGLGAWTGRLDAVLLAALVVFVGIAVYRYRVACRRAS